MLTALPVDDSRRIRAFFEEAGYTELHVRKHLGAAELPSPRLRNMPRLLDRTSEPSTLNALLRWFWLAVPQNETEAASVVPADILQLLLHSGLLVASGDSLHPAAMLLP